MSRIDEIHKSLERGQGPHYQKEAIRYLLSRLEAAERVIEASQSFYDHKHYSFKLYSELGKALEAYDKIVS